MAHDVAIVGAGHNGLICAAYLARAGLDVVVLEARDTVGGCASTVDALGTRVNACNCDHISIRSTPVQYELELERHGLYYLDVDPAQLSMLWEGDRAWFLFHDVERTLEALRLAYPSEVDAYRRYVRDAVPVVRLLLEAALSVPTRGRLAALAARHPGAAARLVRWSRASAVDVLRTYFSNDALVAPACVVGPAVWGVSPALPGTGLGALGYALRHAVRTGRPAGGSGALGEAIAASFRHAGGTLHTGSRVASIRAGGDGVHGVVLDGEETLDARAVVVACDPRRALVEWLRDPPAAARRLVERWRATAAGDGYQTKVDAVIAAPPRYRTLDGQRERLGVPEECVPTAVVTPSASELDTAWHEMRAGRVVARPPAMVNVPSVLDERMRVGDAHVLSLEALYTPYSLEGGWAGSSEPDRWVGALAGLAPRLADGVLRRRTVTPEDWERDFLMDRGFSPAFGRSPVALLVGQDPELTRYETPVRGLFLTGQATFPGASVWGASGRNAARVIARRCGADV